MSFLLKGKFDRAASFSTSAHLLSDALFWPLAILDASISGKLSDESRY
jgi:hypothetical protein